MIMTDGLGSVSEDDITDPDGSCLLFSIPHKGIFTAAHGKEEGNTDEPSSCLLLGEDGHLESVVKDYWGEGFFMLGGGIFSCVAFGLALDVGVDFFRGCR